MDTIEFLNREFTVRELVVPEFGNVLISTTSLNELLLNEHENYVSDEACSVDENIFYFVEENEIQFADEDLINLLIKEVR